MHVISRIKQNGKVLLEVEETSGKTSVEFYPQEQQKITVNEQQLVVRLGKAQFDHRVGTLYLDWYATPNTKQGGV